VSEHDHFLCMTIYERREKLLARFVRHKLVVSQSSKKIKT
jgi:hypothetical protein